MVVYASELNTTGKTGKAYETQSCKRMQRISWKPTVRNDVVFKKINEQKDCGNDP